MFSSVLQNYVFSYIKDDLNKAPLLLPVSLSDEKQHFSWREIKRGFSMLKQPEIFVLLKVYDFSEACNSSVVVIIKRIIMRRASSL